MNIPEGLIDALKEASEAIRDDARGPLADELYGYAVMLAAAPTPPAPECKCDLRTRLVGDGCEICNPELAAELAAPEVEPVYQVMRKEKWDWDTVSSDEYEKLKGMKMRDRRILYIHPANDGLRKAAEEAEKLLSRIQLTTGFDTHYDNSVLDNLRAELEKDKS